MRSKLLHRLATLVHTRRGSRRVVGICMAIGLCALLSSRTAAAQPGLTTPSPAPVTTAPADESDDAGVALTDARGDQGFLVPTAFTQPKGSYTLNDRMVLIPGVTYGISDRIQVSGFAVILPAVSLGAEFKARYIDWKNFHLAFTGYLGALRTLETYSTAFAGALFGVTATQCFGTDCSVALTGSLMGGGLGVLDGYGDDTTKMLYSALAVSVRMSRGVKLLGEAQAFNFRDLNPEGAFILTGVRLHSRRAALDMGVLMVAVNDRYYDGWYLEDGLAPNIVTPWLNLAYRWN